MFSLQFDGLGTRWFLEYESDTNLNKKILSICSSFENSYSRFKDDSELAKLNLDKNISNPSDDLLGMLKRALEFYELTNGVFNISVGAKLEQDGYGTLSDSKAKVSKNLNREVRISEKGLYIDNHIRIDLGGIGKGWLIDKLSSYIRHQGTKEALINGGGDLFSIGRNTVFIEHPTNNDMYIGSVELNNESLCSSSRLKRTWQKDGKLKNHIIKADKSFHDNLLSVHVRALDATTADVMATVFLLTDHSTRIKLANKLGINFLEVKPDGTYWCTNGFGFKSN